MPPRQGLAARKPLYAFEGCRQFVDLQHEEAREAYEDMTLEGHQHIRWVRDFDHLAHRLRHDTFPAFDAGVSWVAHRDRWTYQGRRYLEVFADQIIKGVPR